MKKLQIIAAGEGVCLRDDERHIILSVGRKQTGVMTAFLLNTRDIQKKVEKAIEKFGTPIYVRHEIVHNKFVVDTLKKKGIYDVCHTC